MKQKLILTPDQVTENLQRLFPGKDIKCTEVEKMWNGEWFYIETNLRKVVIIDKMIWVKPSINAWWTYQVYCKDMNLMYRKTYVSKIGTCIPFQYAKKKDKTQTDQANLLLQACGLKPAKKEDDLTRLRSMKVPSYVEIYKVIKDIEVISAEFYDKPVIDRWGDKTGRYTPCIKVTHKTGNFSFPIGGKITGNEDQDEQILNIFCNLLNLPVTSQETMAA